MLCLLPSLCWFLVWLRPWRWKQYIPPRRQLTFNGLHGVIPLKVKFHIAIAVSTSNPTHGRRNYIFMWTVWCIGIKYFHFWNDSFICSSLSTWIWEALVLKFRPWIQISWLRFQVVLLSPSWADVGLVLRDRLLSLHPTCFINLSRVRVTYKTGF
jgi:hypothetical protein